LKSRHLQVLHIQELNKGNNYNYPLSFQIDLISVSYRVYRRGENESAEPKWYYFFYIDIIPDYTEIRKVNICLVCIIEILDAANCGKHITYGLKKI
jgi:hypothetical protein